MISWRWVCYPKYILINNFIAVTTFHTLHNLLQFIIIEQVTIYLYLLCLVYCIVGITLCCFVLHMPLFFGCVSQFSVISIHHWCYFVCMILMHLLKNLNRLLFQLFLFLQCLLTGWRFVPCRQHVPLVSSYGVLADFEQVIVLISFFLALLLSRHWFVQCQ